MKKAPGLFYPAVTTPCEYHLTDTQWDAICREGAVKLDAAARSDLEWLGSNWIADNLFRTGARPKQFRKILRSIKRQLNDPAAHIDLNPPNASTIQRHFYCWLAEQATNDPNGPAGYLFFNIGTPHRAKMLLAVDKVLRSLTADPGKARPYDDARRIIKLAEIYERAGGMATAYKTVHTADGMGATRFYLFAFAFYQTLPRPKRAPSGFGPAVVAALREREAERRDNR